MQQHENIIKSNNKKKQLHESIIKITVVKIYTHTGKKAPYDKKKKERTINKKESSTILPPQEKGKPLQHPSQRSLSQQSRNRSRFFYFFEIFSEQKGKKKPRMKNNNYIHQEQYIIWPWCLVHLCKMIISPCIFFLENFDFFGCKGVKTAKNGPK